MNYRLVRQDSRNIVLEYKPNNKWNIIGYFKNLKQVLSYIISQEIEIPEGELKEQIKELLVKIDQLEVKLEIDLTPKA